MEFPRVSTWMSPLHELLATASRENNDGRQTFGRVKMDFPQVCATPTWYFVNQQLEGCFITHPHAAVLTP